MEKTDFFLFARALHVVGVILWIGGVAFVTTVLIPAIKKISNDRQRVALFEQLEGRFALQAKLTTVLTGLTGFYMLEVMDAWERFESIQFWWMHLMFVVWLAFTLVLFVFEPLFLHNLFKQKAEANSARTFYWMHVFHVILLSLSLIAAFGAVIGSHGFRF